MPFISKNLNLPYIAPAQAQKHVTHNEAIRALDAIVQLGLQSKTLSAPPASPVEGTNYFVAANATDAWTDKEDQIAAFQDGAWAFYSPQTGWRAWIEDESAFQIWDGSAWQAVGGGSNHQNLDHVGINATADSTNRLSLSAPASLLNHEGAGHQLKINKNAAADTGSLLYQTGFSGRAEMGLAGNDDFKVKVSPDGSNWKDAINIDRATGSVDMPFTPPSRYIVSNGYRFYCNTDNRWVTSSDDNYGTGYYQANESGGTGTDPVQKWQQQGLFLPASTKIHRVHIIGRANTAEVSDLECYLYVQEANPASTWESGISSDSDINIIDLARDFWFTPASGTAFTGTNANMHRRTYDTDYALLADGFFSLYIKPVGTLTATRYFSATIAIECSLPG